MTASHSPAQLNDTPSTSRERDIIGMVERSWWTAEMERNRLAALDRQRATGSGR